MDSILTVKDLAAGYNKRRIIEGIDLEIERGKIYAIVGPNGCGKTTLLRVLSRSLKPREGTVLLDGSSIFEMNTKKVAQKMAVLSQNNNSASDVSVKTLVSYGRYAHKAWWQGNDAIDTEVVAWAIEKTNLSGYEERKINTLSGGERQRAWIAMALAQKPQILLLDEPTTYLDISHQLEVMELIQRLNREEGITILMVLHDINHAARYADRLIVMRDGGIVSEGDPWEVLQHGMLSDVFGVDAVLAREAESGKPIFYAKKVIEK